MQIPSASRCLPRLGRSWLPLLEGCERSERYVLAGAGGGGTVALAFCAASFLVFLLCTWPHWKTCPAERQPTAFLGEIVKALTLTNPINSQLEIAICVLNGK